MRNVPAVSYTHLDVYKRQVDVETPHGIVTSVITTRSVKDLQLRVGTEVLALVKATEVSIAKL